MKNPQAAYYYEEDEATGGPTSQRPPCEASAGQFLRDFVELLRLFSPRVGRDTNALSRSLLVSWLVVQPHLSHRDDASLVYGARDSQFPRNDKLNDTLFISAVVVLGGVKPSYVICEYIGISGAP